MSNMRTPLLLEKDIIDKINNGSKKQLHLLMNPMVDKKTYFDVAELNICGIKPTIFRKGAQFMHKNGGIFGYIKYPFGKKDDLIWIKERFQKHAKKIKLKPTKITVKKINELWHWVIDF